MSFTVPQPLSLFPLRTVVYPGGWLPLKIFEARYLDLISRCWRERESFGVVCLNQGAEAGASDGDYRFEKLGTVVELDAVDSETPGVLLVRCRGTRRFRWSGEPSQNSLGLWSATAELLPEEPVVEPTPELQRTAVALRELEQQMQQQGVSLWTQAPQYDDAGWVANRWCELLPLPQALKQLSLSMSDPLARLGWVDRWLQDQATASDE
ncbi:MAG: LON peptidase substrate-binding domain-containing protein [Rubrivivax sp.]|jgi:Lon protease-like protein|nr:LON peptidase substrate-binding domain-containing protein [Rubrivivax sp.]